MNYHEEKPPLPSEDTLESDLYLYDNAITASPT